MQTIRSAVWHAWLVSVWMINVYQPVPVDIIHSMELAQTAHQNVELVTLMAVSLVSTLCIQPQHASPRQLPARQDSMSLNWLTHARTVTPVVLNVLAHLLESAKRAKTYHRLCTSCLEALAWQIARKVILRIPLLTSAQRARSLTAETVWPV
jgi:hypothetical protein